MRDGGYEKNFRYKQELTRGHHERKVVEPFKINTLFNESFKKRQINVNLVRKKMQSININNSMTITNKQKSLLDHYESKFGIFLS